MGPAPLVGFGFLAHGFSRGRAFSLCQLPSSGIPAAVRGWSGARRSNGIFIGQHWVLKPAPTSGRREAGAPLNAVVPLAACRGGFETQYCPGKVCPGQMGVARGHPANVLVAGSVVQGLVPCWGGERGTSPRTTFSLCTPRLESFVGQYWV